MSDGYADGELVWYHLYVNRVLKGVLAPPPSLPSFLRGMGGVLKQVAVVQYKMFFRVSGCIKFLLSFLLLFKVFWQWKNCVGNDVEKLNSLVPCLLQCME